MPRKKKEEPVETSPAKEETVVVTINLPVSTRDEVRLQAAVAKMRSMSDWIRLAIEEKLQGEGK